MTDGNDLAFEDAEEFGLAQDEQLFPVDLDRAAGVLAEHHLVAHLDTHSTHVAIIKRVVVRRMEEETKTAGGIVLPDSATEKPSRGEVLAVGPGKTLDNGDVRAVGVKVGDKVVFGQYAGSTVKIDGEELLILSETELFGVLEG